MNVLKLRSRGLSRRHSRASSVDRREIFTKYVARGNEHSDDIHPYENDDPELSYQQDTKDHWDVPTIPPTSQKANLSQTLKCDFRLVRLRWDQYGDEAGKTLGVFIARMKVASSSDMQGLATYFIAHIRQDGLVWR
jgi:hypothetical protein